MLDLLVPDLIVPADAPAALRHHPIEPVSSAG